MAQTPYQRPVQSRPRAVHIVLRDGDTVDGGIYLTDGQALAAYLGTRKNGWVNVVDATWGLEGERHKHAVLHTDHILLASPTNKDYPVFAATQGGSPRGVDVLLSDGTRLRGSLVLGAWQRLSDYLAGAGGFLAVLETTRVQDGTRLGDIALNSAAVKAVRDSKVFADGPEAPPPRTSTERIKRPSGAIEVVTPEHPGDRRRSTVTPVAPRTPVAPTPFVAQPTVVPPAVALTPAEQQRAAALARHWLSQLAAEAHFTPVDVRTLSGVPTIEEIWHALALANDMADVELAVFIATSYKLELADLDHVTPDAIKAIPAKLARKLGVLPISIDGRVLTIAVSDPESLEIEQQLQFATRHDLRRVIATPADIRGAIEWYYAEDKPPA